MDKDGQQTVKLVLAQPEVDLESVRMELELPDESVLPQFLPCHQDRVDPHSLLCCLSPPPQ